jgi:hypothetical protein
MSGIESRRLWGGRQEEVMEVTKVMKVMKGKKELIGF